MTASSIDSVIKVFSLNQPALVHWRIYYGFDVQKKVLAGTSDTLADSKGGALGPITSGARLKEVLESLGPGDYTLHLKEGPTDSNGIITHRFTLGQDTQISGPNFQQLQQQQMYPRGMMPMEQMQMFIASEIKGVREELERKRVEEKLDALEKENKALRKNTGGSSEIIGLLKEGIGFFKLLKMGEAGNLAQVGISGLNAKVIEVNEVKPDNDEATKQAKEQRLKARLNIVAQELYNREGSLEKYVNTMYCMNEWIKENPDAYAILKESTLNKYLEGLEDEA